MEKYVQRVEHAATGIAQYIRTAVHPAFPDNPVQIFYPHEGMFIEVSGIGESGPTIKFLTTGSFPVLLLEVLKEEVRRKVLENGSHVI